MPRSVLFRRGLAALGLLCATGLAFPAGQRAGSLAALQARLDRAKPGDTITVPAGRYESTAAIVVRCAGTAAQPITITAEQVGGVEIGGVGGFTVVAPAAHVVIRGFRFTHAAGGATVRPGTAHVRFTRNVFQCAGEGAEIDISGDDAEVDHNEFRDKGKVGNMVSVTGVGRQVARRTWIHHNYFHDYANAHANGAETLRLGRSFYSMSRGDALVEWNLFVRCTGENELITNKSGGNTYRFNTFLDSPGAQLTFRHGNDCTAYGNIFRGTDGLRIFGDRQRVVANYFEGNTRGINLGNGDGEVADGAKLTCRDRPDDCLIAANILVENKGTYQMDGRKNGLGATRTTFAGNIIQGGGAAVRIGGPNPGAVWRGNLLWRTGGPGDLPATGFVEKDPRLVRGADSIWRPAEATTGAGDLPRDLPPVSGIKLQLLTPADVGPAAP